MRALKVFGLGIAFSFVGFFILSNISMMRGPVGFETGTAHATGLSAIIVGILEAVLNPPTLLVIVIALVAATWLTRKTSKRTSTS